MTEEKELELLKKYKWLERKDSNTSFHLFGIECGDGWYFLLDDLLFNIDRVLTGDPKLAEDFMVSQIKEKFGGLRFYYYGGNDEIDEIVSAAEKRAETICEGCGKNGKVLELCGWLRCECPECHEARKNHYKELK